jgi:hypothetical protein
MEEGKEAGKVCGGFLGSAFAIPENGIIKENASVVATFFIKLFFILIIPPITTLYPKPFIYLPNN